MTPGPSTLTIPQLRSGSMSGPGADCVGPTLPRLEGAILLHARARDLDHERAATIASRPSTPASAENASWRPPTIGLWIAPRAHADSLVIQFCFDSVAGIGNVTHRIMVR